MDGKQIIFTRQLAALELVVQYGTMCNIKLSNSVSPQSWRKNLYISGDYLNQILGPKCDVKGLYPKLKFCAEVFRDRGAIAVGNFKISRTILDNKKFCPIGSISLLIGSHFGDANLQRAIVRNI